MGAGGTLRAVKAIRAELIYPTIAARNGRLVETKKTSHSATGVF
jgi:hypothetical protein